jgi:hypothetical protein
MEMTSGPFGDSVSAAAGVCRMVKRSRVRSHQCRAFHLTDLTGRDIHKSLIASDVSELVSTTDVKLIFALGPLQFCVGIVFSDCNCRSGQLLNVSQFCRKKFRELNEQIHDTFRSLEEDYR